MTIHVAPTGIVAHASTAGLTEEPQTIEVKGVHISDFELRDAIVDPLRDIGITRRPKPIGSA